MELGLTAFPTPAKACPRRYTGRVSKTFYIETFGCQMNAHDSEKVIGTLEQQGYAQVQDEAEAGLILYNTCSIRDKAEQKVFHRLADYKKLLAQGKKFGVLGCVAQQEGEKIFERAPHVSLVCGSASYRKLPQMLAQLEAAHTTEPTSFDEASSRSPALSPAGRGISLVHTAGSHWPPPCSAISFDTWAWRPQTEVLRATRPRSCTV